MNIKYYICNFVFNFVSKKKEEERYSVGGRGGEARWGAEVFL